MNWIYGEHGHIITEIARGLSLNNKLNNYLELGIEYGNIFNKVAPLVKDMAVAVEINKNSYHKICHNKNLLWNCCSTDDYFDKFISKEIKFDLIFIDADHGFESVKKDFNNSFKYLNDGGIILLHDVYPPEEKYLGNGFCTDAYKIMDYIKKNYLLQTDDIATIPIFFGIGFIRKTKRQLDWQNH